MIFDQIYTRASFVPFLRTKLFSNFNIEVRPLELIRKTTYFVEKWVFQLGIVKFDEEKLHILEIEQKSSKDPRITLTKDAFKILDDNGIDDALVIFHSKDTTSFRLSLLTTRYEWWDNKTRSPYKRFSYILWPWEKIKTPKIQLSKPIQSHEDLISRFKVEVVRDDFFEQYLELFVRLYKSLEKDTEFIKILEWQQVDIVSFTKTLIGKIVFLYFIQQKWWLWLGRKEFK